MNCAWRDCPDEYLDSLIKMSIDTAEVNKVFNKFDVRLIDTGNGYLGANALFVNENDTVHFDLVHDVDQNNRLLIRQLTYYIAQNDYQK